MRHALLVLLGFTLAATAAEGAGAGAWLTDFDAALAKAKQDKRLVLADFAGSDWCFACRKLKEEVLDTPEFKAWAADRFVLVDVDFPIKTPQSDEVKKRNAELEQRYDTDEAFPLIVFIDAQGRKVGQVLGYEGGGPKAWIQLADAAAKGTPEAPVAK